LFVVTGPPGAGKSTVAAHLVEGFDRSALVLGDSFFGFLRAGALEPWLPRAEEQNTAVVEGAAAAAGRLARYCDVVYDGVIGPWFLPNFIEHAQVDHLQYAVLLPPLDVCLERVRLRQGHGFTDLRAAQHMWQDFDRADIAPRYLFQDPVADVPELARRIRDRAAAHELHHPRG
jgi:cytidylate kinase